MEGIVPICSENEFVKYNAENLLEIAKLIQNESKTNTLKAIDLEVERIKNNNNFDSMNKQEKEININSENTISMNNRRFDFKNFETPSIKKNFNKDNLEKLKQSSIDDSFINNINNPQINLCNENNCLINSNIIKEKSIAINNNSLCNFKSNQIKESLSPSKIFSPNKNSNNNVNIKKTIILLVACLLLKT